MTSAIQATQDDNQNRHEQSNVQKLLNLLDPMLVQAIPYNDWENIEPVTITLLLNTVSKQTWIGHLALAAVALSVTDIKHNSTPIGMVNSFLQRSIPDYYPTLENLNVEQALINLYKKEGGGNVDVISKAYKQVVQKTTEYITLLTNDSSHMLHHFLIPKLVVTSKKLSQLAKKEREQAELKRKNAAQALAKSIEGLLPMVQQRCQFLADLDIKTQNIIELVRQGQSKLPFEFEVKGADGQAANFRLWDKLTWIESHRNSYSGYKSFQNARRKSKGEAANFVFLQCVETSKGFPWFLHALQLGVMHERCVQSAEKLSYIDEWGLTHRSLFFNSPRYLGKPTNAEAQFLVHVQEYANTVGESGVFFVIAPLLSAATIGTFVFTCLMQTAMRIGELEQLTLDDQCIQVSRLPQFDAINTIQETSLVTWNLYPKGRNQREAFIATQNMMNALLRLAELHKRFFGNSFPATVPARYGVSHSHRFDPTEKYRFVLQWAGKQLTTLDLQHCLDFVLLEHPCRLPDGRHVRITLHLVRHGIVTHLRAKGVSLSEIAKLIQHVNLEMTDYYSKPTREDAFRILASAVQILSELAEIDPTTVRTPDDIKHLEMDALRRFGVLRKIPGGTCGTFTSCEVHFACASCKFHVPDPARREEVQEQQQMFERAAQMFRQRGDYLEADNAEAAMRAWKRTEAEISNLITSGFIAQESIDDIVMRLGLHQDNANISAPQPHQETINS